MRTHYNKSRSKIERLLFLISNVYYPLPFINCITLRLVP
jgi:hypothetical protein